MTPSQQRLYEELTAATGATPIELADPGTQRCLRFLIDGEGSLDDFIEGCYGEHEPTDVEHADDRERSVTSLDIAASLGIPFHDVERRLYVLPRRLIERIERTYREVSRAGFLTDQDFEERLYQWLSESAQ